MTFRSGPLPRPGPRRLIDLCWRTCYLSCRHLSGCPVNPSFAPSPHQGDDMAASCGRDAPSCPFIVPLSRLFLDRPVWTT